jgi:hypothetical protein
MGEFGAVSVVSGHITGQTETMPLRVEKLFQDYDTAGSFALATAGVGSADAAMGPNDKFDLVIKGGDVLDPSQSLRGKHDIGILVKRFLREAPAYGSTSVRQVTPEAISALAVYDWPGNVEELRGVVDRMVLQDPGESIAPEHIAIVNPGQRERALEQAVGMTVADMEREMILRTLEKTKGNRTAASKLLGLTTRTLSNKIRIYRAQGFTIIGGRKKKVAPAPMPTHAPSHTPTHTPTPTPAPHFAPTPTT